MSQSDNYDLKQLHECGVHRLDAHVRFLGARTVPEMFARWAKRRPSMAGLLGWVRSYRAKFTPEEGEQLVSAFVEGSSLLDSGLVVAACGSFERNERERTMFARPCAEAYAREMARLLAISARWVGDHPQWEKLEYWSELSPEGAAAGREKLQAASLAAIATLAADPEFPPAKMQEACRRLSARSVVDPNEVEKRCSGRLNQIEQAQAAQRARDLEEAQRYAQIASSLAAYPHAAYVFGQLSSALGGSPPSTTGLDELRSPDQVRLELSSLPSSCQDLHHGRYPNDEFERMQAATRGPWTASLRLTSCDIRTEQDCNTQMHVTPEYTRERTTVDHQGRSAKRTETFSAQKSFSTTCSDEYFAFVELKGTMSLRRSARPEITRSGALVSTSSPLGAGYRSDDTRDSQVARGELVTLVKEAVREAMYEQDVRPLRAAAEAAQRAGQREKALELHERARRAGGDARPVRALLAREWRIPEDHLRRAFDKR